MTTGCTREHAPQRSSPPPPPTPPPRFGNAYGTVFADTNGMVFFENAWWGYVPSTNFGGEGCAVLWQDWYVRPTSLATSNLYSKVTATEAVITWVDVMRYGMGYDADNAVSYQMIIKPDGSMTLQYKDGVTNNQFSLGMNAIVGCRTPFGNALPPGLALADAKIGEETAMVFTVTGSTTWELACDISADIGAMDATPAITVTVAELTGAVEPANQAATPAPFTLTYDPATPTVPSSIGATGSSFGVATFDFIITFDSAVTVNSAYAGDLATDLGFTDGALTVTYALTANSLTEWVVTGTITGGVVATTISVGPLAEALPMFNELTQAGATAPFTLEFTPTSGSYEGSAADGTNTGFSSIEFTAKFLTAVTGVTEADFGLVVTGQAYTTTIWQASPTDTGEDWTLSVTATDLTTTMTATVSPMAEMQGGIVPVLTNEFVAGYTITYVPPMAAWSSALSTSGTTAAGDPVMVFMFTASSSLVGVDVDTFGCTADINTGGAGALSAAGDVVVTATGGTPATDWVLTFTATTGSSVSRVDVVCLLASGAGTVVPDIVVDGAASDGNLFTLSYTKPPNPVPRYISSTSGATGEVVSFTTLTYTVSFTEEVTGVDVADFGLTQSAAGVVATPSVASVGGGDPAMSWVLTVQVDSAVEACIFTVAPFAVGGATSATQPNTVGLNDYNLVYTPPTPVLSCGASSPGTTVVITATFDLSVELLAAGDFTITDTGALGIEYNVAIAPVAPADETPPRSPGLFPVDFASARGGWKDPIALAHTRLSPVSTITHTYSIYPIDIQAEAGWSFPSAGGQESSVVHLYTAALARTSNEYLCVFCVHA